MLEFFFLFKIKQESLIFVILSVCAQIHANIDYHDETRHGSAEPLRYPLKMQVMVFVGVISGMFLLRAFLEDYPFYPTVLPKQYPAGGKVHYTFESK